MDFCSNCGCKLTPIYFKAEYKNRWREYNGRMFIR